MMRSILKKQFPLLLIIIMTCCFFKQKGFFSNENSEIIVSDGHGYYAYLPALFIYKDASFSFFYDAQKKHYHNFQMHDFISDFEGKKGNKYFIGTAILLVPFFILAHFFTF